MEKLLVRLGERGFDRAQWSLDEPMAPLTTMRVGGNADLVIRPRTEDQVNQAIRACEETKTPFFVMGNGSNLIVRDGGVRGAVILLGEDFSQVEVKGEVIYAQAGAKLAQVAACALRASLSGLEFASGIPGTVGGGVAMNAGAYGGELKDVIRQVAMLEAGEIAVRPLSEMAFGYRTSRVFSSGGVVLGAAFALARGSAAQIAARMNELNARRRDKQPLTFPSSGSTFKRPEGRFAGALIEQAGLKGARVGGAQVSEKHAGFVVNASGATASDVIALIQLIQDRVFTASGVHLTCEVSIIGED